MSVQLIAGKTFCKKRGNEAGAEAIKRLKVGQLVLVEGKTNVGNRESLGHWADKRSLDIVVFDYRILEEAGQRPQLYPAESTPRQQQRTPLPPIEQNAGILALSDVLGKEAAIHVVDDKDGIAEFQHSLQTLLGRVNGDGVPMLVGLDCEWKPNFMLSAGEQQPVLLLQISLHPLQKVYLLDLQALVRPCLDPNEATNELEEAISKAIAILLDSPQFLKVGFQLTHDLQRLAGSYPHIAAFQSATAITEVAVIARKAMHIQRIRNAKQLTSSLSRLTRYFTEKLLNKDQQVSDWSSRPLAAAQQEYAALDAALGPVLLEKSMALVDAEWMGESQFGRYADDATFANSVSSVRFFMLESDNPATMRRLKAKNVVSNHWLVTQTWTLGRDVPTPPSAPSNEDELYVDVRGIPRVPTLTLNVWENVSEDSTTALVGSQLGKSKDSCLETLLSGHADFPEEAKLDFNQRSGYVEFNDVIALFVNLPVRPGERSPRGYPNIWLEEGKYMTWYLRKNEWKDGSSDLAQKLQSDRGGAEAPAILFVKTKRGNFLCCGRCRVSPTLDSSETDDKEWGLVELRLELLDWDALQNVDAFVGMASASSHQAEGAVRGIEEASSTNALARAVMEGDLETARTLAFQMVPSEAS